MSELYTLHTGNCKEVLASLQTASVDAVVTDPPYELGFMGKSWDKSGIANDVAMWREVLRVLKPGGHLLSFAATRTVHRMTCAIEDAGFEIRDQLTWHYGQGFPKSLNLGGGLGTALKPASEPIVLARAPLDAPTIAANVLKYGTGGLNIDACRISTTDVKTAGNGQGEGYRLHKRPDAWQQSDQGRWPANVVLSCCGEEPHLAGCPVGELDVQSGVRKSGTKAAHHERHYPSTDAIYGEYRQDSIVSYGDSGVASRFFYVSKPDRTERDAGLASLPHHSGGNLTNRTEGSAGLASPRAGAGRTSGGRNIHPTVKPVDLMRYLCRLITPPGGVVLDPFMGSGTTGAAALAEGFRFIGIDLQPEYVAIAEARLQRLGIRQHTMFETAVSV